MKKIMLAVLALVLLVCGAASASQSNVLLTAIDNASFLIMEINSSGNGFESDGVFDDSNANLLAVSFNAEDYSFAEIVEMKKNDPEGYKALMKSFLALSMEFNAVCDVDLTEKVHVVFTVMSNDGVGLFLTVDGLDLTWMVFDY